MQNLKDNKLISFVNKRTTSLWFKNRHTNMTKIPVKMQTKFRVNLTLLEFYR